MEDQVDFLSVQLMHMVDLMDAKLDHIELNQEHLKEMTPNKRGQVTQSVNIPTRSLADIRGKS